MNDADRCPARSRLTDAQCVRRAGHPGRHAISQGINLESDDADALWSEPAADKPATLYELLAHLHDLVALCRSEGYAHMADALHVVYTRIALEHADYERRETTLRDLPPLE